MDAQLYVDYGIQDLEISIPEFVETEDDFEKWVMSFFDSDGSVKPDTPDDVMKLIEIIHNAEVQAALDNLVSLGLVEVVFEDGDFKYCCSENLCD